MRLGVRWAETMRASCGTPSASSVSAAWRKVAQSDWLPMMMPTSGDRLAMRNSPQTPPRERGAIIEREGERASEAHRGAASGADATTGAARSEEPDAEIVLLARQLRGGFAYHP